MTEQPRRRRRGLTPPVVQEERTVHRAVAATSVGNVAVWYDFGIYSYLAAAVLDRVLFPDGGQWATAYTLAAFAAAFLMRPLGGFVFGRLGDRIGRTKVLSATMLLMAVATVLLGLVPSHGTIGLTAPLLVLLVRMLQGFAVGGEYTGALTLIAEYAPDRRRGFFGSWLEFSTLAGYALGAGVCAAVIAAVPEGDLLSWGWRLPFMLALPLGLTGIYLRMRLEDTPAFRQLMERSPALSTMSARRALQIVVVHYRSAALVATGVIVAWNVTNYVMTNYVPTYLAATLPRNGAGGSSQAVAATLQVAVMVLMLCVIVSVGRLSDRIGRKPVLMAGSLSLIFFGLPAVWLLREGLAGQVAGLLIMGMSLVCFAAVSPSTLPALFPTMIRYSSLAVIFNLAVSLFAGTAPTIIEAAVTATGNLDWPGFYLVGAGVIGVISTHFLKEQAGRPLDGAAPLTSSAELPAPPLSDEGVPLEQPRQ
ncbi:MFS transporter [Saccharopolyspora sp. NFXS83]|uniref:MFS transporter n=1 Tax=Saccharopolyspora sp. NFXS83 TaxID=2993560 RepID=UPI00224B361C|nr:MFS transporter [Saccharopolyspora sp. NFXS83]MCX2733811.1 MFS transporter [Saccharopolyspora sp. NFXS83]